MYDIEFPNGDVRKYAANIIAVKFLAQVDPEGFHTNILKAILDHITIWKFYVIHNRVQQRIIVVLSNHLPVPVNQSE